MEALVVAASEAVAEAVSEASEAAVSEAAERAEAGKLQLDSLREWQLVLCYTAAAGGTIYR